jgi:hypothetical protein
VKLRVSYGIRIPNLGSTSEDITGNAFLYQKNTGVRNKRVVQALQSKLMDDRAVEGQKVGWRIDRMPVFNSGEGGKGGKGEEGGWREDGGREDGGREGGRGRGREGRETVTNGAPDELYQKKIIQTKEYAKVQHEQDNERWREDGGMEGAGRET